MLGITICYTPKVYVIGFTSQLSAVEVAVNKRKHLLAVVANILAQSAVVKCAQRLQDAVNHSGTKDTARLEDMALTLKAVCRCCAAIGKLCEVVELRCVLLLVDIYVDVCLLGNLEGILQLEAVAARHNEARDKLVYICRAIGRAHLHGLLLRCVVVVSLLQRIGNLTHIALCCPAEWYTHQYRAVAVAPADVRWRLLMWHKTEV